MCRDTLGRFPDLSVMEARAKAFEYKARIARGGNPVGQRDAEPAALRAEKTFAQMADEFWNLQAKPHKRSWREMKGGSAGISPLPGLLADSRTSPATKWCACTRP